MADDAYTESMTYVLSTKPTLYLCYFFSMSRSSEFAEYVDRDTGPPELYKSKEKVLHYMPEAGSEFSGRIPEAGSEFTERIPDAGSDFSERIPEPERNDEVQRSPVGMSASTEKMITGTSRKARIQVHPNASLDLARKKHYLTSLPVVQNTPAPYNPCLYTFRVRAGKTKKVNNAVTKPPPFYLQFDHTIAVVWCLFNPNASRNKLGIVQLHWGLHFLETIYNDLGDHPKDVELCITGIQDLLIDKYAALSEQACIYTDTHLDFFEEEEEKEKSFSLNYCQISQKCPVSFGAMEDKESLFIEPIDKQILDELENVKKAVGIDSIDLTKVVSKEQVLNILEDWKKEQLDKIQEELRLLYIVEDMLKNSDSQKFEGYTDETHFKKILRRNT